MTPTGLVSFTRDLQAVQFFSLVDRPTTEEWRRTPATASSMLAHFATSGLDGPKTPPTKKAPVREGLEHEMGLGSSLLQHRGGKTGRFYIVGSLLRNAKKRRFFPREDYKPGKNRSILQCRSKLRRRKNGEVFPAEGYEPGKNRSIFQWRCLLRKRKNEPVFPAVIYR